MEAWAFELNELEQRKHAIIASAKQEVALDEKTKH